MLVSTKGRYALRVMVDLAEHQAAGRIPLKEIAARQGISEKYLENILATLVRANMLSGMRGKGGGYVLTRPPEQYTVGEILRLTEGSRAVLRGERRLQLRKEQRERRERDRSPRSGVAVEAADLPRFQALRDLRAQLAREQNVPAYVIFHDSTLRTIAEQQPATLDDLARVGGIGGAKLARYGERVLEALGAVS